MKIRMYKFPKRDNSTKQPGASDSYIEKNVALKDDTNINTPSFELHMTDSSYNYVYVPDWNKYYFVSSVTYINNSEVVYSLEEDSLASKKTEIGNTVAHIAYSSTGWNKDLVDSRCAVSTKKTVLRATYTPTSGGTNVFNSTGCFILSVASTSASGNGFVSSYVMDLSELNKLTAFLMAQDFTDPQTQIIKSVFKPMDAIISCMWLPLASSLVSGMGVGEYVTIGDYTLSSENVIGYRLNMTTVIANSSTIAYTPTYNDFRSVQPYTTYTLYIPMYGPVDLNASDLQMATANGVPLNWSIDVATGDMTIEIYEGATKKQIFNVNIGVSCPIAQTSLNTSGAISSIGGVAGGIVGMGASIATGNVAGAITSSIGALTSATNATLSANTRSTSVKGSINGRSFATHGLSFVLTEYAMVTEDCNSSSYIAKWGRPVGVTHAINNHSGYVQCDDASVDMDGDSYERAKINGYLNSGFYYE